MQYFLKRLSFLVAGLFVTASTLLAQNDTTRPKSLDPALLGLENGRPKEFTVNAIRVTGAHHLDTAIVLSISGIQVGDKLMIPGTDAFSKAITNLWRQRLFSNIQIFITSVQDNNIALELSVQERPRLSSFKFVGPKKSEIEDLQTKVQLAKSTIITENTRRNAIEAIQKFYSEKGYLNVNVRLDEQVDKDPNFVNSNILTFYIDKGQKVKVSRVRFFGNEAVSDYRLKKEMKDTKEMTQLDLKAQEAKSPFGVNDRIPFKTYWKSWGFMSFTKTRAFLDPYLRVRPFSAAKFDRKKYEQDLEKVLDHYNALGYRDAQIEDTAVTTDENGNLVVDVKISEGRKYYFGNLEWRGNTKYSDSLLNAILRIRKGDTYNLDILNKRLGKQMSAESGDISALYMDDGYLFFRAEPIETAVYNDTIDYELRIVEGTQATVRSVNIYGNEKTKDYVIRRELRTVPGEKFSRSDLIRSQRELSQLQYFNPEKINPGVESNQEDGTVDINWTLEEKSSDQLELSAGWGGGVGLTGTLGVTFNNFSIRNIFKKETWDPLPSGDGQKLSLRLQSNGRAFRSYNFSFTEPWLGGKKRNPFTISFFNSKYANLYYGGSYNKDNADRSYLRTLSAGISLGKQLKWPDDYFSLMYTLNYTQYKLKNYGFAGLNFSTGTSNNVSFKLALQRSSVFDPQFPTGGSNITTSLQLTPPYSLLRSGTPTVESASKNPEYHKWRFNAEWFVPLGRPAGAEKNRLFVVKLAAKYGFMGRYNRKQDFSPFERFQIGGDGLTNNFGILGYDVIALRGYPVFQTSDPSINPDMSSATEFFTIFNKYQLELRYPLVRNASSTIYAHTFFDAANGWKDFKSYNPFRLRRSVGVGMRFFLPMFGMLGFDYGIGLDRLNPGDRGIKNASKFTFMLGFEPE